MGIGKNSYGRHEKIGLAVIYTGLPGTGLDHLPET